MTKLSIYSLKTLCWAACGGRHYVGTIHWYDPKGEWHRHELERKLSLREAKELDPDAGERYWKMGLSRTSNRFDTRDQLERHAIKWVEEHAAAQGLTEWLFIDNDTLNPNRPLAGKGYITTRFVAMRQAAEKWDKMDNAARNALTKKQWNTIYSGWNKLLKPNLLDK